MSKPIIHTGPCSAVNCEREAAARGWCRMHYKRYWTHGDVDTVHFKGKKPLDEVRVTRKGKVPDNDRFWAKVNKTTEDGCWLWTGSIKKKKGERAYGLFGVNSKSMPAHRYSYGLAKGEFPMPHTPVHHTCGETLCVNPKHLQATTPQENTAEMLERRWYQARIAELEGRVAELESQLNT